ncbi:MAG: YbbR-like domain-containing protein [Lachnospirales bacterium]
MSKIKELLLTNLGWKIISLLIAIMTWFVATNINNPVIAQTFAVQLELRNLDALEDNDLILLNLNKIEKETVNIRVKGTRRDIGNYKNGDLVAYIDFKPININNSNNTKNPFLISILVESNNSDYEIIEYTQKTIEVTFDNLVTKEYKINVNTVGELAEGFNLVGEPSLNEPKVMIKGAEGVVSNINDVSIQLDFTDKSADFTEQLPINIYNESGQLLNDDLSLVNPSEVTVTTRIDMRNSIPISAPMWSGVVENGYRLITPPTWTPSYVEVYGNEETIDSIPNITLSPVDVTGATEDVVVTYNIEDLLKDTDLTVTEEMAKEVTVTFKVEPIISRDLIIPISNMDIVNEPNNFELPDEFTITISGPETAVNSVDVEDIVGTLDLENTIEGENQITPALEFTGDIIYTTEPIVINVYGESTREISPTIDKPEEENTENQ